MAKQDSSLGILQRNNGELDVGVEGPAAKVTIKADRATMCYAFARQQTAVTPQCVSGLVLQGGVTAWSSAGAREKNLCSLPQQKRDYIARGWTDNDNIASIR